MKRYRLIEVDTSLNSIDKLIETAKDALKTKEGYECKKIAKYSLKNPKKGLKLAIKKAYPEDKDRQMDMIESVMYAFDVLKDEYNLNSIAALFVCIKFLLAIAYGKILLYPKQTKRIVDHWCKVEIDSFRGNHSNFGVIVVNTLLISVILHLPFSVYNLIVGKHYIWLFAFLAGVLYRRLTYSSTVKSLLK